MNIVPTLFAYDIETFKKKYEILKDFTNMFQIDIMDGKFVPSKSVDLFELDFVKDLEGFFEVHLMCNNPQSYFEQCTKMNIDRVIIHYESIQSLNEILRGEYPFEIALSINPSTSIEEIKPILSKFKTIMLMGVVPGLEGQSFIESTYNKVKELRELDSKINIEIDGGVKEKEIRKLSSLGANTFGVGSFITSSENPKENYELLVKAMRRGRDEFITSN